MPDNTTKTTFAGTIYGGGNVNFVGSGAGSTLDLTGQSTYTGSTTINGATIQLGVANALPITTNLTLTNIPNSGTQTPSYLALSGFSQTVASLAGNGYVVTVLLGNGGGGITVDDTTAPTTFSGVISGTGGLTLGAGNTQTLTLTGPNTYTGPTTIDGGILQMGVNNALSNGATATTVTLANTVGTGLDLNNFNVTTGPIQGGGVLGGNVTLGLGSTTGNPYGTGGTLTVNLYNTSTFAGNLTGNGNVTINGIAGSQLIFTGTVNVNGGFVVDPQASGNLSPNSVYYIVPGAGNALDLTNSQQIAAITGGDNSGSNTGYTGNGVIDNKAAKPTLTIAATNKIPSTSNTFAGNFWNDVSVALDGSINNVSQTLTLTGSVNPTTGSFEVGNFQNPASTATSTLIVDGILGDNGTYGSTGTTTVGPGGILAGIGVVNPTTTVQTGGTVRGGVPNSNGANNYGTLTFNQNSNAANLQLLGNTSASGGGATLQTEVDRTGGSPTGNTFATNTGTPIGNASLIDVSKGNLILGVREPPMGWGTPPGNTSTSICSIRQGR